jgi:cellobiose phosphorylase
MFVLYGRTYAQLLDRLGKSKEAQEARNETDAMEKKCIRYGWDGNWFIRAYDALGGKVGSKDCAEGKIFIEPQGFCTMAGIGEDEGLGKKAMSSVWQYLVNDFGIELIAPPYSTYHEELGEISSYPPGYKENGSVFCHNNPWVILAESKLGHGNEAYSLYCRNSPAFTEEKSDIHRSEPYCYSQTIAGRQAPTYGEAKNSWLTGTAAWSFVAVSQGIFGIKPDWDGLLIDPCLPDSIGFCRIIRQFRGTTYEISIDNSTHSGYQLTVDGERVHGKLVRHNAERKRVDIKLSL